MNKIYIFFGLVLLTSCGLSVEEKKNIALNACSIMGETKKSDSLFRMQTIVDAREKIGGEPFEGGDDAILEALNFGLCEELVLNESYNKSLQFLKDAKQERERIAEEKQRIENSKPIVKETFYGNGILHSRVNYQPKSGGRKKHGLSEFYDLWGELERRYNYKDGKLDGPGESYKRNGKLRYLIYKKNYKDGILDGLQEEYYDNGQVENRYNYKYGKRDGLIESYHKTGEFKSKGNLKDGKLDGWEKYYHINGELREIINYKDGKPDGLQERYHNNGELKIIEYYKDGKLDGLSESYYKTGQLKSKGNFKDGEIYGPNEIYHSNGQLESKRNWKGGYKWGLWEFFNENGILKSKVCYKRNQATDMSYCEK